MNQEPLADNMFADAQLSRRGVLRAGGITIALAALVAACADEPEDENPARVGSVPPAPTLPEGVVTDGVIFRTATSMHYSFIDAINISKELGDLDTSQTELLDAFITAHEDAIVDMQAWTVKAGAEPWTCSNPRFDRTVLVPITDRITGRAKIGNEEVDVAPSQDPTLDSLSLTEAMENLCCAMHQAFVQSLSTPEYRAASINQGQLGARRAAALALEIDPANVVNPASVDNANLANDLSTTTTAAATTTTQDIAEAEDGATTTTINTVLSPQTWYAIPSQFGQLNAIQLSVGAPLAGGSQFTFNLETPSLNTYIYDFMTEC